MGTKIALATSLVRKLGRLGLEARKTPVRSPDHTERPGKGQNISPKCNWEDSALEERTIL